MRRVGVDERGKFRILSHRNYAYIRSVEMGNRSGDVTNGLSDYLYSGLSVYLPTYLSSIVDIILWNGSQFIVFRVRHLSTRVFWLKYFPSSYCQKSRPKFVFFWKWIRPTWRIAKKTVQKNPYWLRGGSEATRKVTFLFYPTRWSIQRPRSWRVKESSVLWKNNRCRAGVMVATWLCMQRSE